MAPFRFLVRGHMLIGLDGAEPDTEVGLIGDVAYENRLCQIDGAVRVKDWLFCVEKMADQERHYLGAFYAGGHYSFHAINVENLQAGLLEFVATRILPVLSPELFTEVLAREHERGASLRIRYAPRRLDSPYLFRD